MSRSQEVDKCMRPEGKTSRSEEAKKDTHTETGGAEGDCGRPSEGGHGSVWASGGRQIFRQQ